MFCTECGQQLADEAKFCAFCGTRRAVPAASKETVAPPAPAPVPEPIRTAPPAGSTIRSTAEITPIRVQRPAPPPPAPPIHEEPPQHADSVVPWPAKEEATPSLFTGAEAASRQAQPAAAQPSYSKGSPAEAPAQPRYGSVPFAAEAGAPDTGEGRRKVSPVLIGAIVVAAIALGGIFWMVRSSLSLGGKAAAPVTITIYPPAAKVAAGKGIDFVAEVTGAPTSDVTWSVEEGDNAGEIKTRGASAKEDTISLYCTYTAPKTAGTYHLVATSTADKTKSATAEITITAK